jgi:predicted alpha/beta hydrolase family esterase
VRTLWFHAAASLTEFERVDRLLLVSPPASELIPDAGAEFRLNAFDAAAVRASVRDEIHIACSDADPYNPQGARSTYARALAATTIVPDAGHITPDSGYGPWAFAETWCAGPNPHATADA